MGGKGQADGRETYSFVSNPIFELFYERLGVDGQRPAVIFLLNVRQHVLHQKAGNRIGSVLHTTAIRTCMEQGWERHEHVTGTLGSFWCDGVLF